MPDAKIDAMVMDLLHEIDYDIAKSFDPECSEEPEFIPERMERLRRIVKRHTGTP